MGKSFSECFKPNKINLILMLSGYAIWYIFGTVLYAPLNAIFIPPSETVQAPPLELNIITLFLDLLVFYLVGSFAYWLVYYFKE